MGILDDLSMGLGLKDRDDDYYERTARTLGRTQGEAREAQYRHSRGFGQLGRQGLLSGSGMGGYRDTRDMFDRGGPNAKGGVFQGGGLLSDIANMLFGTTQQTSGFGTSASLLPPLTGTDSGMNERPFNADFYDQYLAARFEQKIPEMMTYNEFYDKMFP